MIKNFIRTNLNDSIIIDNIITLHYFDYIKKFLGIGESHDFWEMVYVDCGSIEVIAGENSFVLVKGEAIFHEPNEYHNIISRNEFASVFIVTFESHSPDVDYFRKRRVTINIDGRTLISNILKEGRLVFAGELDIMDQTELIKRIDAVYGGEQIVKMLLESFLINIIRNTQSPFERERKFEKEKMHRYEQITSEVINTLMQNLYKGITLNEICTTHSYSKVYTEKAFKKCTGYGIIKYYNSLKIREAKRLISEGKYTFMQISELLNFGSLGYFSRKFKQYTNMSPTEYAKSVKARALL